MSKFRLVELVLGIQEYGHVLNFTPKLHVVFGYAAIRLQKLNLTLLLVLSECDFKLEYGIHLPFQLQTMVLDSPLHNLINIIGSAI